MAKITLSPLTGSYGSVTAINSRLQQIEDTFNDNILWRDGFISEPNAMDNDLDMNGYTLLNATYDFGTTNLTLDSLEAASITQGGVAVVDLSDQSSLGGKDSAPTTRNDGVTSLVEGDTYYNKGTDFTYSYDGSGWNIISATAASTAAATSISDTEGNYFGVDVEAALMEGSVASDFKVLARTTPTGQVRVKGGTYSWTNGTKYSKSGDALVSIPPVVTSTRYDWIVKVKDGSTISRIAGTEGAGQADLPSGYEGLAVVRMSPGATVVLQNQITDYRAQDADGATVHGTETLTNKTLTDPVINGTVSGTAGVIQWASGGGLLVNSGTSVEITNAIPSWAKQVIITFETLSTSTAGQIIELEIADSGGYETSGYSSVCSEVSSTVQTAVGSSTGMVICGNTLTAAGTDLYGAITLNKVPTLNKWRATGSIGGYANPGTIFTTASHRVLNSALEGIRINVSGGVFDGTGIVEIQWYG